MRRKAETHQPRSVSRIINGVEVKEEIAEISLADPAYGKLRIVNSLVNEMGKTRRLKEGDDVDVVLRSDGVEPNKS
jgi:hypothetical protein